MGIAQEAGWRCKMLLPHAAPVHVAGGFPENRIVFGGLWAYACSADEFVRLAEPCVYRLAER